AGLNRDYSGTIETDGDLRLQMVFQDPFGSLNPAKKIGWILEEPLRVRGVSDRAERKRMAEEMLVKIGLDESFYSRRPRELSGGQRQRISIGTALLADSRLLVADEPVSALDVTVQSQILKLLLDMHEERKNTLLFVSHDLNVVRRVCHRVAVLYLGEVVESGAVEEIYHNPCHPYTRLLLASSLGENSEKEKAERNDPSELVSDIGENFGRESAGCPFYPRCPKRSGRCALSRPETMSLENGHKVKCFGCQAPSAEGRQKGEAI
ncbi:MAG: ABC transporter ATP-binding protein, partial [Clostridium sp.]